MAKAVETKKSKKLSKMERIKQRMKARQNHDYGFLISDNIKNDPELKMYFEFIELLTAKNVKLRGYIMVEYITICVKEYSGNLISLIIPKHIETSNTNFTKIIKIEPIVLTTDVWNNSNKHEALTTFKTIPHDRITKKYIFNSMNDFIIFDENGAILTLDNEYKWNSILDKRLYDYYLKGIGIAIINTIPNRNTIKCVYCPTNLKLSWIQYSNINEPKMYRMKYHEIIQYKLEYNTLKQRPVSSFSMDNSFNYETEIIGCYVDELCGISYCIFNAITGRASRFTKWKAQADVNS